MSSSTIFHSYAPVYETTGEEWVSLRLLQILRGWLREQQIEPASAADLACGSGAAAVAMTLSGMSVYGVDSSPAMLALAQQRAAAAAVTVCWLGQDLRSLELPAQVDLATALYDSLNYLLSAEDLFCVVARAAAALAPAGVLAFDLNTLAEYQRWSDGLDVVSLDTPDAFVLSRRSFNQESRSASGRIIWMLRQGERWQRGEELHRQRAHSADEIASALERAGLTLRAELDLNGQPAGPEATRILYIAQKLNAKVAE